MSSITAPSDSDSVRDRTGLILYLRQHDLVTFETTSDGINVFTICSEAAAYIVLDSVGDVPRIGIPYPMTDLVGAPWLGWRPVDDCVALVGYSPGKSGSFELRIPVDPLISARFEAWYGRLHLGRLIDGEEKSAYDIVDPVVLDRIEYE